MKFKHHPKQPEKLPTVLDAIRAFMQGKHGAVTVFIHIKISVHGKLHEAYYHRMAHLIRS